MNNCDCISIHITFYLQNKMFSNFYLLNNLLCFYLIIDLLLSNPHILSIYEDLIILTFGDFEMLHNPIEII